MKPSIKPMNSETNQNEELQESLDLVKKRILELVSEKARSRDVYLITDLLLDQIDAAYQNGGEDLFFADRDAVEVTARNAIRFWGKRAKADAEMNRSRIWFKICSCLGHSETIRMMNGCEQFVEIAESV